MSLVSSISALATRMGAEIKAVRLLNKTVTYVLAGELQSFPDSPTELQKRQVLDNNNAVIKAALIDRPYSTVTLDPSRAWPLALDINEFSASAFTKALPIRISGRVQLVRGTATSKGDTHTNVITAAPVVNIVRAAGAPIALTSIDNALQLGPNLPAAGICTQFCTGLKVASGYSQFKTGQVYHLSSNNYYAWSTRAVNSNTVWKAAMVPIAGLLVSVSSYSLAAMNTSLGLSGANAITTMERRSVKGATSLVTAVVQGDITGTSNGGQVVVNSISGDFTAGESLVDAATGAVIGTFGAVTVLMSGKLNTTYPTSPVLRLIPRNTVELRLSVECDGDPDEVIPEYNRSDAIKLAGVTDFTINVKISAGYAAGVVLQSCWKGKVDAEIAGLPNHALEGTNAPDAAYGYGVRLLGCTDDVDIRVHIAYGRHALTTNGSGVTYNLNSRTGAIDSTGVLATNYWSYGPGARNCRITGIARCMYGTGWDTHEGAEDLLFDTPVVVDPLAGARSTTGPDGITIRGFNITVLNPYFKGVRTGVSDGGVALDSGGLIYVNRVLGGLVEDFQSTGYNHSDFFSMAQGRVLIEDTVFRADPLLTDATKQQTVGLVLRSGRVQTRNVRIEGVNYAMIQHKSTQDALGRITHQGLVFDWTDATANSAIRQESTFARVDLLGITGFVNPTATVKPQAWVRCFGDATPFFYRGIIPVMLGGSATVPPLYSLEVSSSVTSTATFVVASGLNESTAGADGKSAYDIAVAGGYSGTSAQWIASLKGTPGNPGADSTVAGPQGKSAYEVAVAGGYAGTSAQWLTSLVGAKGADSTVAGPQGKSAYQSAVDSGYAGTEAQWAASLKGAPGTNGAVGPGQGSFIPTGYEQLASYVRSASSVAVPLPTGGGAFVAYPHIVVAPQPLAALTANLGTPLSAGTATVSAKWGLWADLNGLPDLASGPLVTGAFDLTSAAGRRTLAYATTLQPGRYWIGWLYLASAAPTTAPVIHLLAANAWNLPMPAGTSPANGSFGLKWTGVTDYPTSMTGVTNGGANEAPAVMLKGG